MKIYAKNIFLHDQLHFMQMKIKPSLIPLKNSYDFTTTDFIMETPYHMLLHAGTSLLLHKSFLRNIHGNYPKNRNSVLIERESNFNASKM